MGSSRCRCIVGIARYLHDRSNANTTDANTDCDREADSHSNSYGKTDCYSDRDGKAHCDADANSKTDCHPDCDGYTFGTRMLASLGINDCL